MKLSVVMPAYNEMETIEAIIQKVLDEPTEKELIIVDDGSVDGTRDYLQRLKDDRIRVFFNEKNLGKGGALRRGFKEAKGDYCVVQDADLEYDPKEYAGLLDLILEDKADVVYGSRFLGRTRVFYFYNLLGNKIVNFLMNLLFNSTFTDLETCYKCFKREAIEGMNFRSNSFGIEVEFSAHFVKKGCRIYEVPITYYGRTYHEGKKITWRDGLIALYWILYFRFFD